MVDPQNQIIFVKRKRVDFDSLPLHLQEKLLILWKVPKSEPEIEPEKIKENDTRKRKKTSKDS